MHHNKRTCAPLGIWGVQLALLNSPAEPPAGRGYCPSQTRGCGAWRRHSLLEGERCFEKVFCEGSD